jgi:hypothetical protein
LTALIKNVVFDLDKAIEIALIDLFHEDLIDLTLIEKGNFLYF